MFSAVSGTERTRLPRFHVFRNGMSKCNILEFHSYFKNTEENTNVNIVFCGAEAEKP
jgi:hypothetical protein